MKLIILILIYIFFSTGLKSQILKFDVINNDSCMEIKLSKKKTYVICYDKFHNLTRKGFVFNGKLDSKWEIYSDGKLFKIGSYKNDKRVGTWKEYYVSGTEVFIGKYKNDFQTGKWKVYESEIDLRVSKSNSKMKLTEIRKYKEGKLIEKKLIDINGKCIKIEKCQK